MRDQREIRDALKRSRFRAKFRLGPRERSYLGERGFDEVIEHAKRFITERLAPARPVNDGKQTPWRGHPVFIAQHATATCCRNCLLKWHRLVKDRELTTSEQAYIVDNIAAWLKEQGGDCRADFHPRLF